MTLGRFIAKNAFRNKRRSLLTVISIAFSLLLLTLMMTIWRSFYIDKGPPSSALRLVTRHRVSIANFMPKAYREKIRNLPGVIHVAQYNYYGGKYKDDRPENFFAQFGTDPEEIFQVFNDWQIAPDELKAWQHDQAGAVLERALARRIGVKAGDRIHINHSFMPVDLDLTVRGLYDAPPGNSALLFNYKYIEEAIHWANSQSDLFIARVDSPEAMTRVAQTIDAMFRNSPVPTKTETEKAFELSFVAMMGNVKAFILGISMAVVFAILLVSGNTVAMTIRERVREVAVLKTLGFTREAVLAMFIIEAVTLSLFGGSIGVVAAIGLVNMVAQSPQGQMLGGISVTVPTLLVALLVAAMVGFVSAFLPSYRASRLEIAEGLRHVG
jgi:putative ABC transport system permease protein